MDKEEFIEYLPLIIVCVLMFLLISAGVVAKAILDTNHHYEYTDFQGQKGISQYCRSFKYKSYGFECDTENGREQVQAFKYVKD